MFGFLGQSKSKTKNTPWAPQGEQLETAFQGANDWLTGVQQPGNQNPNIQAGQDQQLGAAQSGFGGVVQQGRDTSNFFSNPAMLNPSSNPYLQGQIDTLGQNITQQMGRNQNTINQQAAQQGAYGGSRQGVAQGLNAESANREFAQGTNDLLFRNYMQGLQQMQAQQEFLPRQAQLEMLPGMVQEQIGQTQQDTPLSNLQKFMSVVGSQNWGGTSSGTNQASPLEMFGQLAEGAGALKSFMG
ncbi:hypothetical protein [Idiomarina abyssalis]|uniref:hypothetical protein n=1 Tax=Idiomarina abyssalis TaxID=86102 RepID=UPI003A8E2C4E